MPSDSRRRFLRTLLGAGTSLGLGGAAWLAHGGRAPHAVTRTGHVLGTEVSVTALHPSRRVAAGAIAAAMEELVVVDQLMSLYRDDSQLCRLNRFGALADPHPYLVEVLEAAGWFWDSTGGAFDATVQPLWRLYADASAQGRLPGDDALRAALRSVDWRRVDVTRRKIRLAGSDTAVTLNGIAQGFAADRATAVLRQCGIEHALVEAGEISSLGGKTVESGWTVGIRHPRRADAFVERVSLEGRALASSGDYATSFSDDHRDNHLFDPRTGRSPQAVASVSVAAATAIEADGLSTALCVLGPGRGLALLAETPAADAMFVFKDGSTLATDGFPTLA